jgi:hypothetical protein
MRASRCAPAKSTGSASQLFSRSAVIENKTDAAHFESSSA